MRARVNDYYELLGVGRNATLEQIRKAYRDKVKRFHPDVADDKGKADEHIKLIYQAWEVLSDPDRRRAYNQLLGMEDKRRAAEVEARRRRAEIREGQELFRKARIVRAGGMLSPAKELALKAAHLLESDWEAWWLVGEIALEQQDFDTAIEAYTQALRYSKHNPAVQNRLDQVLAKAARGPVSSEARFDLGKQGDAWRKPSRTWRDDLGRWYTPRLAAKFERARAYVGILTAGWLLASVVLLRYWLPDSSLEELPRVLLWIGALDAFALGLLFDAIGVVEYFDDAMFYRGMGSSAVPRGVLLMLVNFINFAVGLPVYLLVSLFEGEFSFSILLCYAAAMALCLLLAVLVPAQLVMLALWLSGPATNLVFFGWACGTFFRPTYWS